MALVLLASVAMRIKETCLLLVLAVAVLPQIAFAGNALRAAKGLVAAEARSRVPHAQSTTTHKGGSTVWDSGGTLGSVSMPTINRRTGEESGSIQRVFQIRSRQNGKLSTLTPPRHLSTEVGRDGGGWRRIVLRDQLVEK